MDTKTILATLTRAMLASIAGALVHHGVMQSSGTEAFIGAGMLAATGAWGLWNGYVRDIAKASLDLLRARVMNAAAAAKDSPGLAPRAVASLAAHVEATAPAAAPASPRGAQTALMLALTLPALAMAWAGPAGAQGTPFRPTGNLPKDIGTAITKQSATESTAQSTIEGLLAKPFQELAKFIGDDSDGAIALSTQIPALQDGHGQQCWMATKQFGDVIKAHPVPLTLKAQTDLQALRLLMMAANNLCANVHCTQVFGDLANGIQTLAPLNASVPIPSLHDICAKIPQIAVVPPVTVPTVPIP